MNEAAAARLDPAQAGELARVLDLQAQWENLRETPAREERGYSTAHLQGRQKTFEAFRSSLKAYTVRYRTAQIPEVTLNSPVRVGSWCRSVRAVFERAAAATGCPAHAVEKAYRMADRIAARLKIAPVGRAVPLAAVGDAVRGLDAIIGWCDGLAAVAVVPPAAPEPASYEVGERAA